MSTIRVNQIQDTSTNVAANISGGIVTFTNPPIGMNNGETKLLEQSFSGNSTYDINNTYINSTYDHYKIILDAKFSQDSVELLVRFFLSDNASGDAGSIISGNHHSYGSSMMGGSTYKHNNASSYAVVGHINVGNGNGEGISIAGTLHNVNATDRLVAFNGAGSLLATNGAHQGFSFHAGMATPLDYGSKYCRGIRFYVGGGTIAGKVKVFGIR